MNKEKNDWKRHGDWSKASKLIDFLGYYGLAKEVIKRRKLYVQPLRPMSEWIGTLLPEPESDIKEVERPVFDAKVYDVPIILLGSISAFREFYNFYGELPLYKGTIHHKIEDVNMEFGTPFSAYWLEKDGIIYAFPNLGTSEPDQLWELSEADFDKLSENKYIPLKTGKKYSWTPREVILNNIQDENLKQLIDQQFGNKFDNYLPDSVELEFNAMSAWDNFQELKQLGYSSADEFMEAVEYGILSKSHLDLWKSKDFQKLTDLEKHLAIAGGFDKAKEFRIAADGSYFSKELYDSSRKGNFSSLEEYIEATKLGFPTAIEFQEAKDLGYKDYEEYSAGTNGMFRDAQEYRQAQEGGFSNREIWMEAQELNLTNIDQYNKYLEDRERQVLEAKPHVFETFEVLKDASYTLDQIYQFVKGKFDVSKPVLEYILDNDVEIDKYGSYSKDTKIFNKGKKSQMQIITSGNPQGVVVDVSNIAWDGKETRELKKPIVRNIERINQALTQLGISDITWVAKANLRHLIDDKEKFAQLKNKLKIKEAPGGSSDDGFIIKIALKENRLIVSNDLFRDWQKNNPKYANRIKELSTKYMISEENVMFEGSLSDWLKNPKN